MKADCENVNFTGLAQNYVQWQALVMAVLNL
jgi:hypothetical protein